MNFAAPAVILVLLLLPGVVARSAYLRGKFNSHPFRSGAIADELAFGTIFALVLHAIWECGAHVLAYSVQPAFVFDLIYGPTANSEAFRQALDNVTLTSTLSMAPFRLTTSTTP